MTNTTPKDARLERAITFLDAVKQRTSKDNGAKAIIKRALSGDDRHVRQTYRFLLPLLENISESQQTVWMFVASLSTYHEQSSDPEPQDFARSCLDLQNKVPSQGPERRFRTLLDTALVDIQSPIAALVRQFKSQKIQVYYPKLIVDLDYWEHPDQFIQDRWARTFWRAENAGSQTSES